MSEHGTGTVITRAVLVDPGRNPDMGPFLDARSVAMLPVGTKPLVQHWMEKLADAGVREVLLLLVHLPEQVRTFVGSGERWGIAASYAIVREDIPLRQQLLHAQDFIHAGTFIGELNSVPAQGFQTWIAQAKPIGNDGLIFIPGKEQRIAQLLAEGLPAVLSGVDIAAEHCGDDTCRTIANPRELWQINMDLLEGKFLDSHPAGFESERGVFVSRNFRTHTSARLLAPCVVGENSFVRDRATIGPRAILGNHVFADIGCSVNNSVVFDRTFIGSFMELNNVVASGRVLYKIDTDVFLHIDDPSLIGEVASAVGGISLVQRLVALILLLMLCVPVMLRAIWLKIARNKVLLRETLILESGIAFDGQKQTHGLDVTSLAVTNPAWRKALWLWQVVRGEIALTGVTPRMTHQGKLPDWAADVVTFPAGVITLADITGASLSGQGSEDELVADAYYQATATDGLDTGLVWRWLMLFWKSY